MPIVAALSLAGIVALPCAGDGNSCCRADSLVYDVPCWSAYCPAPWAFADNYPSYAGFYRPGYFCGTYSTGYSSTAYGASWSGYSYYASSYGSYSPLWAYYPGILFSTAPTAPTSWAYRPAPIVLQTAQVRIRVADPNAKVWIDDRELTGSGPERSFESALLKPGSLLAYKVKSVSTKDGQQVTATRQIYVSAGANMLVDFSAS